jgi:hypothetical protein
MEDWILGPKDPTDIQGLLWFTDGSGAEQRTAAGIYGHKTRLFFSPGKEMYRRRI